MPVPEVSCLGSQKLSPTESSEEPKNQMIGGAAEVLESGRGRKKRE